MESNWMPGGEPFHISKGRVGCLLIHGFTGAPYEMRELGEFLAERDITVSGPALAGHATDHRDMEKTRWPDWYETVRNELQLLRSECDKVFVAGLSLGGLQSLHLATHHKDIAGVISMAAPVGIRSWMIPLLLPLVKYTPIKYLHRFHKSPPPDFKNKDAVKDHVCYAYTPMACVFSIIEYMNHVRQDLNEITAPILVNPGDGRPHGTSRERGHHLQQRALHGQGTDPSRKLVACDNQGFRETVRVRKNFRFISKRS